MCLVTFQNRTAGKHVPCQSFYIASFKHCMCVAVLPSLLPTLRGFCLCTENNKPCLLLSAFYWHLQQQLLFAFLQTWLVKARHLCSSCSLGLPPPLFFFLGGILSLHIFIFRLSADIRLGLVKGCTAKAQLLQLQAMPCCQIHFTHSSEPLGYHRVVGRKGPLAALANSSVKVRSHTAGCTGMQCPGKFGKFPQKETPQPPCTVCFRVLPSCQERKFS